MTKQEVKRFLNKARILKQEAAALRERIERLHSLLEKNTPSYSGMPGGGNGDRMTELTAKIIELEKEERVKLGAYLDEYRTIEKAIAEVEKEDIRCAHILRLRYLDGKRWEYIADALHYDLRWVYVLHGVGLGLIGDNAEC